MFINSKDKDKSARKTQKEHPVRGLGGQKA